MLLTKAADRSRKKKNKKERKQKDPKNAKLLQFDFIGALSIDSLAT